MQIVAQLAKAGQLRVSQSYDTASEDLSDDSEPDTNSQGSPPKDTAHLERQGSVDAILKEVESDTDSEDVSEGDTESESDSNTGSETSSDSGAGAASEPIPASARRENDKGDAPSTMSVLADELLSGPQSPAPTSPIVGQVWLATNEVAVRNALQAEQAAACQVLTQQLAHSLHIHQLQRSMAWVLLESEAASREALCGVEAAERRSLGCLAAEARRVLQQVMDVLEDEARRRRLAMEENDAGRRGIQAQWDAQAAARQRAWTLEWQAGMWAEWLQQLSDTEQWQRTAIAHTEHEDIDAFHQMVAKAVEEDLRLQRQALKFIPKDRPPVGKLFASQVPEAASRLLARLNRPTREPVWKPGGSVDSNKVRDADAALKDPWKDPNQRTLTLNPQEYGSLLLAEAVKRGPQAAILRSAALRGKRPKRRVMSQYTTVTSSKGTRSMLQLGTNSVCQPTAETLTDLIDITC